MHNSVFIYIMNIYIISLLKTEEMLKYRAELHITRQVFSIVWSTIQVTAVCGVVSTDGLRV